MKVPNPQVSKKDVPSNQNITELIKETIKKEARLTDIWLQDQFVSSGLYKGFEASNADFDHVVFEASKISNGYFFDVEFRHCDLSNITFDDTLLRRVHFKDCKLQGLYLSECILDEVYFENCILDYASFGAVIFKKVKFKNSNLNQASFLDNKQTNYRFKECMMKQVEFLHSSLNKIDLTSDNIEGLQVSLDDLKGAIVSPSQALDLAPLLGITIK